MAACVPSLGLSGLGFLTLGLSAVAPAQAPLVDLGGEHLPYGTRSHFVALADFDGDGRPDLLSSDLWRPARWLRNAGGARFVPMPAPFPSDSPLQAVADVDRDGDLDIVLVGMVQATAVVVMRNDGSGHFTAITTPLPLHTFFALAVADVDGDAFPDVVLDDFVLLSDHAGGFTIGGSVPPTGPWSASALVDVDQDGDADLVIGERSSYGLHLLLNDGSGHFTRWPGLPLSADGYDHWAIASLDVDGDGDPDLLSASSMGLQLYVNQGFGTFVTAAVSAFPTRLVQPTGLHVTDVDGSGAPDVVVAGMTDGSDWPEDHVFLNLGSGYQFADASAFYLGAGTGGSTSATSADVDGDGDTDLCFGRGLANGGLGYGVFDGSYDRLLLNQGARAMVDATRHPLRLTASNSTNDTTGSPLPIDVDGDGALDLVVVPGDASLVPVRLLHNDGQGGFDEASAPLPAAFAGADTVAGGDVDGDGNQDLVIGGFQHYGVGLRLLINDGSGGFADRSSQLQSASNGTGCVGLFDVDGDADLDLVSAAVVQRNDGQGQFTVIGSWGPPGPWSQFDAADADGDGDLDLLVVGSAVYQLENDGTGGFVDVTASRMPGTSVYDARLAVGDLDGDGRVDVVVGQRGGPILALHNQGGGVFADQTATRMPARMLSGNQPRLADVDEDGDLDLLAIPALGPPLLYVNDGRGVLTDQSALLPQVPFASRAIAVADVDRDGDPDLVSASGAVLFDLRRQMDAPFLPLLGSSMSLRVVATTGLAKPAVAQVVVSPRLLPAPIALPPAGALQIDLTGAIALPSLRIPGPSGLATTTLAIPNVPALLGGRFAAQGLVVPPSSLAAARLTNAQAFVIPR